MFGGVIRALFAKTMLVAGTSTWRPLTWLRAHPLLRAGLCGCIVAGLGMTTGLAWGTGYQTGNAVIAGMGVPAWFGAAKFLSTLATAISGVPGGIFAPSLSVGAGLGDMRRSVFPDYPPGAIVLLGMVAYFTGVVRAPLTAVIIISEPRQVAASCCNFSAQPLLRISQRSSSIASVSSIAVFAICRAGEGTVAGPRIVPSASQTRRLVRAI
ncbi:chloride channel protein [Novosphingobium sp. G106]|uniref:chloride channel protein n=1 Tax=Novosphingobium sp. G106 TaxID=2849500 RepID=UPI0028117041|nr:chloride channel protein [Novosphingobium sp. G106]